MNLLRSHCQAVAVGDYEGAISLENSKTQIGGCSSASPLNFAPTRLGSSNPEFASRSMSALPPKADIAEGNRNVRFVPKADINPPTSRASLLVGHNYARIVSPHGSLQLGGINVLALCPLDKVVRAIRWISAASQMPQTRTSIMGWGGYRSLRKSALPRRRSWRLEVTAEQQRG